MNGNCDRHDLLLIELVLKKSVGRLVTPFDGAYRTIRLQQAIELGNDRLCVGAGSERNDEVIEGAFHVKGGFGRAAVDPQNGKEAVVGNRNPRLHRINILRRERDAGNAKALYPAVENNAYLATWRGAVRVSEGLVDDGAVRIIRSRRRAAPYVETGQWLVACMVERNHARRDWQKRRRPVDDDIAHNTRLYCCNAWNRRKPRND